MRGELHAVIGVVQESYQGQTLYVKRSATMQNYPNVWSLLSIQFAPDELPDPLDMFRATSILQRMSDERLGGVGVYANRLLTSGTCSQNTINARVTLHLYEISLLRPPILHSNYYVESAWLTPSEYEIRAQGQTCGLCMRLWSDYCVRNGLASHRFAPAPEAEE